MNRNADFTHDENIMTVLKTLGATSEQTAVSSEELIEKGIEMKLTEPYPRGKKDGHPWRPRLAVMMGVGSDGNCENHEEKSLHRVWAKKSTGSGYTMFYWIDTKTPHENVKQKCTEVKQNKKSNYVDFPSKKVELTLEQKLEKAAAEPDKYLMIGDRLLSRAWAEAHPEKIEEYKSLV